MEIQSSMHNTIFDKSTDWLAWSIIWIGLSCKIGRRETQDVFVRTHTSRISVRNERNYVDMSNWCWHKMTAAIMNVLHSWRPVVTGENYQPFEYVFSGYTLLTSANALNNWYWNRPIHIFFGWVNSVHLHRSAPLIYHNFSIAQKLIKMPCHNNGKGGSNTVFTGTTCR